MLIETWIAAIIFIFFFIISFTALIGWICESERRDKECKRSADLAGENCLLKELRGELEKKIDFLQLQLELEKHESGGYAKPVDDANTEESAGERQ